MARRKKSIVRIEDDVGPDDDAGVDQRTDDPAPSASDGIYSMPPLYDLAFGYRSYEDEVEFLLRVHAEHSSEDYSSARSLRLLELAAGPARHSLAALSEHPPSRVDSVVALDRSRAMVDYGLRNADRDLGAPGGGRRDDFDYVHGDMRNGRDYFTGGSFDSAWLLLGSMQHLLTNDDIVACFSSLHSAIKSGGTVVIELPHPRETFSMGECTTNGWTVPLVEDAADEEGGVEKEYGELSIVWGEEGDAFDPVSQIRNFSIGLELRVNDIDDIPKDEGTSVLFSQMKADGKTTVKEVVPLRLFTMQEIDALARIAGFELVAKYGALDDVSIDDEGEAFRMVCVLRKG
jgi:SAM-dependent methyltransferase